MRNPLRNERGAVFVLIGLALTLLAAVIGFATDYGVLAYTQNQGQAAVDTAALAGASGIAQYRDDGDDSLIQERIAALDDANDVRGLAADLGGGGATVELLVYDSASNTFTCESGCEPELVNAVRVTKTGYATPVYFSWARNLLGGTNPASYSVAVSAVGHLSCPAEIDSGDGIGVIALRECEIDYPDDCNVPQVLQGGTDNSAFTTFNLTGANVCKEMIEGNPPTNLQDDVKVGDVINLVGTGQATSCLKAVDDRFAHCKESSCESDPPDPTCIMTLPVIDCAGPESNAKIVGFAEACITDVQSHGSNKWVKGEIECSLSCDDCGGGGACFGLVSNQPYLIR